MSKILEKIIKDAIEEDNCSFGIKAVISTLKNSKLVVISNSIPETLHRKIDEINKHSNVPMINFEGSSIALGRLCGTQFRVSALSLKTINDINLKSILKENEQENIK